VIEGAVNRTVSGSGVELSVIEAGARDRPTIVFVHGYPDTKEIWDDVLERLASRFHVVAYDVRGAGGSSAPRGPAAYDFELLAEDLLAVIGTVSPDAPVHLVGHDWGGIAGWELVTMPRVQSRVASFTTIAGPSLRQLSAGVRMQLRRGHVLDAAGRVRRSWYVLALCTPGVPTLVWRGALGRRVWMRYLQYLERVPVDAQHPAPTFTADAIHGANLYRRNIMMRIGHRADPQQVRVPVQIITPSADRFISPKYYDGAERYAHSLRRRTVAGSHWAPRAQPEPLARWIGEFVDEAGRGVAGWPAPWVRGGGARQLRRRLALVTGAGSGIGAATALALAAHGARLLLVDRDADAVARTAEAIAGAHAFTCDVADEAAMEGLAARVVEHYGVPDVVVNNAGIAVAGSFLETGFDDWRRVLDVNVMGVVHGCRLFGAAMVARGAGGHIVNTASAAAFAPAKDLPAYAASKAAVLMMSECVRAELVPHGIGVTAVCPGLVATNITRTARYVGRDEDQQARAREQVTKLYERRNFTPDRVAAEIIRAIAQDIPVAVVTPEAKVMRALSRFAPRVLARLAALDTLPG